MLSTLIPAFHFIFCFTSLALPFFWAGFGFFPVFFGTFIYFIFLALEKSPSFIDGKKQFKSSVQTVLSSTARLSIAAIFSITPSLISSEVYQQLDYDDLVKIGVIFIASSTCISTLILYLTAREIPTQKIILESSSKILTVETQNKPDQTLKLKSLNAKWLSQKFKAINDSNAPKQTNKLIELRTSEIDKSKLLEVCYKLKELGFEVYTRRDNAFATHKNAWGFSSGGIQYTWVCSAQNPVLDSIGMATGRLFAVVAFVVFLPVFAFLVAWVFIANGFPIIFTQDRRTAHSKVFKIKKLRTMKTSTHDDAGIRTRKIQNNYYRNDGNTDNFKVVDRSRLFLGAKLIRSLSLDELPQLLNVLCGQMLVFGPRPFPPQDTIHWEKNLAEIRHSVPPGLIGHWQVYHRGITTDREQILIDCEYILSRNLLNDLRIFIYFPISIFSSRTV